MRISSTRVYLFLACLALVLVSCQVSFLRNNSSQDETFTARTFTVTARSGWTGTGIRVQAGTHLKIRYLSGQWSPWPGGAYDAIGFGGDPRCDCNVIPAVSHAALIARIGDSQPFLVGKELDLRTGESGELYLGINDTDLNDNSGSMEVEVQVR